MVIPAAIMHRFVGREEQINLIEDRIGIIRYGGSVFQALINFYGVIGIGKTFLLQELEKRIRDESLPCAFIDFAEKVYDFSPQSKVMILEEIADSFSSSAILAQTVSHFWQRQRAGEPVEEQIQAVLQTVLDYVSGLVRDHNAPAVLLLDTLERANKELLDWLEDAVLSRLIRTDRVLVIVASRAPHRWKRFEVRRRAYQQRLDPFDEETTKKQLPQEYTALASNVVDLTHGHPFGNVQVLESVRQIERDVGRPFRSADFEEYQKRLVQELVDELIEPVVMKDISREIRRAYRVVALARQFDVNVLRRLLTRFVEEPFADKSAAYFLSVVGSMVKTTLVEWSSGRRGYVLDKTIRWMLALNMKLTATGRYEEINQELVDLYNEWIERVPENRSGFIIERLYHEACVRSVQSVDEYGIADRLCELLKDYLTEYYPVTEREEMPPGLTALQEELNKDEELKGFLPRDWVNCLVGMIQEVVNRNYRQSDISLSNPGGQA
jgi:AAA+ ATPase superfamily predicted ATPase